MTAAYIDKQYWELRHWEVTQDLLRARLREQRASQVLDVEALEKYVAWLKEKERQAR